MQDIIQEFDERYDLIQTEDAATDLKRHFKSIQKKGLEDFQYYMVRVQDGEYKEVYGNSRPARDKNDWLLLYQLKEVTQ